MIKDGDGSILLPKTCERTEMPTSIKSKTNTADIIFYSFTRGPKPKDNPKNENSPKKEDNPIHEGNSKNEYSPKNEDEPKNEDKSKNEDNPKNKENPKLKTGRGFSIKWKKISTGKFIIYFDQSNPYI